MFIGRWPTRKASRGADSTRAREQQRSEHGKAAERDKQGDSAGIIAGTCQGVSVRRQGGSKGSLARSVKVRVFVTLAAPCPLYLHQARPHCPCPLLRRLIVRVVLGRRRRLHHPRLEQLLLQLQAEVGGRRGAGSPACAAPPRGEASRPRRPRSRSAGF